jgi:nitrite reductase/ring-hydroxylating ferredoxin subunit
MRDASTALLAVGLASTGTSVASGLADWAELQRDQQRTGLVHAAINSVGTVVAGSVVANRRGSEHAGTPWGSLAVGGVVGAGAALGGHLAYRWGAGANHADDVPHRAPSDWVDVGAPGEFPDRTPVRRRVGEVDVVVARGNGRIHALAQRCSHLGGPLDGGTVETIDGTDCVVCPWHGSAFTLAGGESVAGPAVYPQPRFEVREVGVDSGTCIQVRVVPEVAHQLG